jgi:hypothetical protein
MGVSPSCDYATIYFAPHEARIRDKYPELFLYKRYIDDVFIIWIPIELDDNKRFQEFLADMNTFGKLKWKSSNRARTVNFLDLQITIHNNGTISTRLYEKPENLYLYLPASSCHPYSILKGLIHGMVYRTIRLTSDKAVQSIELQNLVRRLSARGYQQSLLVDIINQTYTHITQSERNTAQTLQLTNDNNNNRCFFHVPYHPNNPKSSEIQKAFEEELHRPKQFYKILPDLLNHRKARLGVNKLIIAYHRPPNLGNLLSTRVLNERDGPSVSSYLD